MRRARKAKPSGEPALEGAVEFPRRKVWVLTILAVVVAIALPVWAYSLDFAAGSGNEWILFLGKFHMLVLHMPIALLLVLWLIEVLGLIRPLRYLRVNALFLLSVTAISACVTVVYGCFLAVGEGMSGDLVMSHLRAGLFLAAFVLIAVPLRVAAPAVGRGGWLAYHAVLLLAVVTMGIASHLGGSITHGETYIVRNMPEGMRASLTRVLPGAIQKFIGLRARDAGEAGEALELVAFEDAGFYHAVLLPAFEASCIDCHGPDRDRGGYRLHELEAFMAGGKVGVAVVPGDLQESELVYRITLPEDDEDFMPPRDRRPIKDPLSAEMVATILWWVESAIPPETPMREIDLASLPEEVAGVIDMAQVNYGKPVERLVVSEEDEFSNFVGVPAEAVPQDALDELNATISGQLLPISRNPMDGLQLITAGVGESFNDESLRQLMPVAASLRWLDLSRTAVTDEGLEIVAGFTGLTRLRLDNTGVTSAGVQNLGSLESLEHLNLFNTRLDDDAVPALSGMQSLQALYLYDSGISREGAERIREALPEARVNIGIEEPGEEAGEGEEGEPVAGLR